MINKNYYLEKPFIFQVLNVAPLETVCYEGNIEYYNLKLRSFHNINDYQFFTDFYYNLRLKRTQILINNNHYYGEDLKIGDILIVYEDSKQLEEAILWYIVSKKIFAHTADIIYDMTQYLDKLSDDIFKLLYSNINK